MVLSQGVALVATWLLFESLSLIQAITVVWAVGFSHYLLGFLYSWRSTQSVLHARSGKVALGLLLVAGLALYWGDLSLVLYFGLHHALNEAYISGRFESDTEHGRTNIRGTSFCVHLLGFYLLTHDGQLKQEPAVYTVLIMVFIVLSGKFYLDGVRSRSGGIGSEMVVAMLIPLDFWLYDIHLYHFVLYHFVFWMVYPASRLWRMGGIGLSRYIAMTVISIAVFVALIPPGIRSVYGVGAGATYYEAFVFLSFLHITLSFATSRANPAWIQRVFKGEVNGR